MTSATLAPPAAAIQTANLHRLLLLALLTLALGLRLFRLEYPERYVYDEVYHLFTAQEMVKGNPDIWDVHATPPPGVAYEWTHPPLAKEAMAASMMLFGTDRPWAARLPSALLGVVAVALAYRVGTTLFQSREAGLFAAFVFCLDGLNFVQSRTAMNDIYLVTFLLASLLCLLNRKLVPAALFFGLAFSSKWTALYFLPVATAVMVWRRQLYGLILLAHAGPLIYLASYLPFFGTGRSLGDFLALQWEMWRYHSTLVATHDYASPWWSWPLNLVPVWYTVDYPPDRIANIFASGNPVVFWLGLVAVALTGYHAYRARSWPQGIAVFGYLAFWLPNALTPRILFLYHYAPAVPYLCLSLGYQLARFRMRWGPWFAVGAVLLVADGFAAVYPFLTGIPLPREVVDWFFLTNQAKNPFGGIER